MDEQPRSSSATRLGDAFRAASESRIEALFGSREFFRLWIAQLISATGDWLGLFATIALADRLSGGSGGAAISLVLITRVAPGLLLSTPAGVLVDRLDRKRVMLVCDATRALVLFSLPFVNNLAGLVAASLVLEVCTMLWSPAKEAVVPNLVPKAKLTTANSLNVAAAYGMFPVAAGIGALLAKISESFADEGWVDTFGLNQEGLAFYIDGLSFVATALVVSTITFPRRSRGHATEEGKRNWDLGGAIRELREGWQFIAVNPIVRAVNFGLAVGVMGLGMLVPLGKLFVNDVLVGDKADYDLIIFALGFGMALGVILASVLQKRINRSKVFPLALICAGVTLSVLTSSSLLMVVVPLVGIAGFAAGPVYVLGFTLLHENVDDDLRGRIFAALLMFVRLCLLLAVSVTGVLADGLDVVSNRWWDGEWDIFGATIAVPGVRLTLWLSAITVIVGGILASWSLRVHKSPKPTNLGGDKP